MRILAIRGCNLASLAGEFEIDLSRSPFCDAGVFAIVGNTGAGKSTLLDALCVALFDRTPRLTNHSRVVVGRGDDDPCALGAQDARTLLRRGAASGWAEVDFESGDARCYRARWAVRRARGQATGALQDQQITLTAIDSGVTERLGGTKTETLKAIVARLGLSFDQFRRSALLAQGEFAAFLRADGKDRSELLERMTGTEIYTRLSVAAHLRATLAEQRLRDGRAAAFAIAVLADDARAAAEAEHAVAIDARAAAIARLACAEAARRWIVESEQRAASLAVAEAEHAAAQAALADADADRAELALRRRAEQLRPLWDAAERLDRTLAQVRGDGVAAEAASAAASEVLAADSRERERLADQLAPIRAGRLAAGLAEPAALGSIKAGRVAIDSRDHERWIADALADAAWLVAQAGLTPDLRAASELDARFAQHAGTTDAIATIDRTLAGHDATRAQLGSTRALVTAEHQAAVARLADAQRKTHAFQQRRALGLDAARRQEEEARTQLVEVERLVAIAAGARQAVAARSEIDRQSAELEAAALADRGHHAELEAARVIAVAVRDDRVRVVDELRRASGYEHARAELRDGEACPLCGAVEHPWGDRAQALEDVARSARSHLDDANRDIDTATASIAVLDARRQHRDRERVRLASHHVTADASAIAAIATWRDHLAGLGELVLEYDPATAAAEQLAAEREAIAKQRLEAARDMRRQTEALAKAAADAQAEVQLHQVTVDQLAAKLADNARALAELEATAERLRGERAGRGERLAELAAALQPVIARLARVAGKPSIDGASRDEPTAPEAVAIAASDRTVIAHDAVIASDGKPSARSRGRVRGPSTGRPGSSTGRAASGLRTGEGPGDELAHSHDGREPSDARGSAASSVRLAGDASERDVRIELERRETRRVSTFAADFAHARSVFAELAVAWRARCERVAAVEARLAGAIAEIDRELRAHERAVADTAARAAEARRRRAELIGELAAAAARLEAARAESGFDAEELRRLFVTEPAGSRIEVLAERLAELERGALRTRAIAGERAQLVREHGLGRPPEPVLGDAAELRELAAQVAAAEQQAARIAATLTADADARERRAAALAMLAASEADANVDRVLGGVIGSHDGKLFRSFAQSLTLDGLLAVANAHLDELAPRYQLERVPRHDLELQVIDRDLGSEVRSVQSLSGGESFLVSLALALGLSSMSAHDVRVRTLLIDEGFGTLDPATLDGALSVLDALQATGRQVGVISHVPALVERVGAHVRVVQRGGGRSEVIVSS